MQFCGHVGLNVNVSLIINYFIPATYIACYALHINNFHTGIPDHAIAMLRTALISVTFVLIMLSMLLFLVGFISGGYYFSQRWRKVASANKCDHGSPSNPTTEPQEGVDLKKNVAYMDLDPA